MEFISTGLTNKNYFVIEREHYPELNKRNGSWMVVAKKYEFRIGVKSRREARELQYQLNQAVKVVLTEYEDIV